MSTVMKTTIRNDDHEKTMELLEKTQDQLEQAMKALRLSEMSIENEEKINEQQKRIDALRDKISNETIWGDERAYEFSEETVGVLARE